MALHYKLNPLFDSISGVISRKRFPDGHVETYVATKKGTIYKRTWYPPRKKSTPTTCQQQYHHGIISQ